MDDGNLLLGAEILQAASQDYPDNMDVRRAVAGAYARIGRYADAVTLFKAISMDNASVGDYQGAISAALGATDMAQAEAWLRQALGRFPGDPQILAEAARFEQARGNSGRAADYWRAALAAMPPGAAVKNLASDLETSSGAMKNPGAGRHQAPARPPPRALRKQAAALARLRAPALPLPFTPRPRPMRRARSGSILLLTIRFPCLAAHPCFPRPTGREPRPAMRPFSRPGTRQSKPRRPNRC